jgi:hypothetical protein
MKDVLILMATAVPTEKLISDMKNALSEWEIFQTDKKKQHLMFHIQLLMINLMTNGNIDKAVKVMRDVEAIGTIKKNFLDNEN